MALPADVLRLLVEANDPDTQLGRTVRQAARLQTTAAPMLQHTERVRPVLEETAKARQLFAETEKMRQMIFEDHKRMAQTIKIAQLAVIRGRTRSSCSGARERASRGRPVRLRGSRRGASVSRAGPSGDPDLADEPPGHRRAVA